MRLLLSEVGIASLAAQGSKTVMIRDGGGSGSGWKRWAAPCKVRGLCPGHDTSGGQVGRLFFDAQAVAQTKISPYSLILRV